MIPSLQSACRTLEVFSVSVALLSVHFICLLVCVLFEMEVMFMALDQCGSPHDRRMALMDKNRDLYLTSVRTLGWAQSICKIGKNHSLIFFTSAVCLLCSYDDVQL